MDAITLKLGAFLTLGPREKTMLEALQETAITLKPGRDLIQEGEHHHAAYILRNGWACSHKQMRDGGRQIIDIQIPGDFIGLRSLLLRTSDQGFTTLTDFELAKIGTEKIWDMFRVTPRLAVALLWVASCDQAVVVEHLVNIGKRDALARTAHFLLELGSRLSLVGHGEADSYACPLSQSILADALGVTAIHLNRVLRQLREAKLLVFKDGVITILDRKRLAEMAGFDSIYLDHQPPVRD